MHIDVSCRCGQFRAEVSGATPSGTNHVSCACKFCQSFAKHLGQSERYLDGWGSTDIVQVDPARIRFVQGEDQLAALTLTKTGPLRWYTRCCQSPVANTFRTSRLPFVGLMVANMSVQGGTVEDALGPIRARVNGSYGAEAKARRGTKADERWMLLNFFRLFALWTLRGSQRRSPFFRDGAPIASAERVRVEREPAPSAEAPS